MFRKHQSSRIRVTGAVSPYAALRFEELRRLVGANFLMTFASLAIYVALGVELYKLTKNPLVLGFIGLAEALPFIGIALIGGHWADNHKKRGLLLSALGVLWLAFAGLLIVAISISHASTVTNGQLWSIYALIGLVGLARGIYSPTASSLRSFIVPRYLFANASTWSALAWQLGAIIGPLLGGVLYTVMGLSGVIFVAMTAVVASAISISGMAERGVANKKAASMTESLREGIDYVRGTPIIWYAIWLDLVTVLFGSVIAILPVFAADVLHVGPQMLGLMRAAPGIGALITMWLCVYFVPTRQPWRNLLIAVAGFGLATLVFGLSKNITLSLLALVATGAFDAVSVIIRSTIMQEVPPEHMRGRVQSVNSIFLCCSNELGAFESGVAARFLGAVPSVIVGAGIALMTVGYITLRSTKIFDFRFIPTKSQKISNAVNAE